MTNLPVTCCKSKWTQHWQTHKKNCSFLLPSQNLNSFFFFTVFAHPSASLASKAVVLSICQQGYNLERGYKLLAGELANSLPSLPPCRWVHHLASKFATSLVKLDLLTAWWVCSLASKVSPLLASCRVCILVGLTKSKFFNKLVSKNLKKSKKKQTLLVNSYNWFMRWQTCWQITKPNISMLYTTVMLVCYILLLC